MKYRRKIAIIDAEIYDGSAESVKKIMTMYGKIIDINNSPEGLHIPTIDDTTIVDKGDYIIKDIDGTLYSMKPDRFERMFEVNDTIKNIENNVYE